MDLLKAEQQVCFQSGEPPETASKVVASPVMNPMPSNLHGYGAVLKTHVVRIGCAHAQLGRADVSNVESTFEGVTVGFEFPNFARAYRGAVVMLKEGETVQLAARFCLKKQVCLWLELSAGCSAQELQEHIRRVCKLLAPHKAKLIAIGRAAKAVE